MEQLYDPAPDEAVYQSVRVTLESARTKAAAAVNDAMVSAYWEIGRHIAEAQGDRAEYGKHLMAYLSERLTAEFGKGFTERNLRAMRQLYLAYPIRHTVCAELSWSHYRLIIRIEDPEKRDFYVRSAVEERWTVRQLDRQIHSFYYERLLATRAKGRGKVRQEIQQPEPPTKADGILKDPYVLDFLDLNGTSDYLETDLEQALMDKLQQFLLELGKGFSFVARQQRVDADGDHYYIDLVFYHYILKCFVLIDLKPESSHRRTSVRWTSTSACSTISAPSPTTTPPSASSSAPTATKRWPSIPCLPMGRGYSPRSMCSAYQPKRSCRKLSKQPACLPTRATTEKPDRAQVNRCRRCKSNRKDSLP